MEHSMTAKEAARLIDWLIATGTVQKMQQSASSTSHPYLMQSKKIGSPA